MARDRHLDRVEGIEGAHAPVAAAHHHGTAVHDTADGIEPAGSRLAQSRLGQLGDVLVGLGPEGLETCHHAELAESRNVGRVDQLEVRDDVPRIVKPVLLRRVLERIEGFPDRAIADGVHVDLKPGAIQGRDQRIQGIGLVVEAASIARAVEIRSEQRCGLRFDYPVGEDLHRPDLQMRALQLLLERLEPAYFGIGRLRMARHGRHDRRGQLASSVQLGVRLQVIRIGVRFGQCHDPEPVGLGNRPLRGLHLLAHGVAGKHRCRQVHRAFPQRTARLARGVPFDPAPRRVFGVPLDPRDRERLRVEPGRVSVGRPEKGGPVRNDPVEHRLVGIGLRENGQLPAIATKPAGIGMSGDVVPNDPLRLLGSLHIVEIALSQFEAGSERMNMVVVKAWQDHPTRQIEHPGVRPDKGRDATVRPNVDQPPLPHGQRLGPASQRGDSVDLRSPHHQISNVVRGPALNRTGDAGQEEKAEDRTERVAGGRAH